MGLGFSEILLILIVIVLIFKPDKLSDYSKAAGRAFKEYNKAKNEMDDLVKDVRDAVNTEGGEQP